MQWREGGYRGNAVIAYYMIGPIGVKGTGGVSKMIYILWKFILLGRRAFSQPEGLFEWDIDAFIIQCQLMNYHLKLKKYVLSHRKFSMSQA